MSDPSDAPSSSAWPIITSGGLISPWIRMRRSYGRYNRQPAARSSKCRTSAGSITITNAAPPDHPSPRRQTGTVPEQVRSIHATCRRHTTYLSVARPLFSRCPSDVAARFRALELPARDPDDGSDRLRSADGVSGRDREQPGTAREPSRRVEPVRDHVRCPIAAPCHLHDGNSRKKVQNVRGECSWSLHVLRTPRCMKMGLVVLRRSAHNTLWNRPHFLSR